MTEETRRSFCRICAPCCGVLVTVDGDRVTAVRGDPDHPVSRGYVCPKGRALGELHHDARRLDVPMLRSGSELQATSWDAALDDLAARIRRAVDEHGPDAVAVYVGTPSIKETAAAPVLHSLCRRLGTRSRYSSITVDIAARMTVTTLVLAARMVPVVDIEDARLLLVLGTNPVVSHGHYDGLSDPVERLREIGRRGEVWVVDPRRTETAHHATRHVPIRPGTDHALLAHLVRSALDRGVPASVLDRLHGTDALLEAVAPWDRTRAAAWTGIDEATIAELDAAIAATGRLAVLTGTGVDMAGSGNLSEWLAWCLLLLTDSVDRPGGMWCNPTLTYERDRAGGIRAEPIDDGGPGPASRPDLPRFFAEHPCAALVDEIEAGTIKVLVSFGGNPLVAIAQPERLRAAIAGLDAFAVIGTLADDQADLASHLLPCTGMLERPDALLGSQSAQLAVYGQYTEAVVPPVAERRAAWWILAELGRHLGVDAMPRGLDLDTATDDDLLAVVARGPDALERLRQADGPVVAGGTATGWFLDSLPAGYPDLAPPALVAALLDLRSVPAPEPGLRLIPRRLLRRFNSVASPTGRQDEQEVVLHPEVAGAAGISAGGRVSVRSANGSVVGVATVTDGIHPEAVALSHGFTDVEVGRLTSTVDADALTGQTIQTGIPISVERAPGPG
ncbi:molybdopterin-containing oxidoreductase family protein [Dermatobacter hominis]|uniref:molybdopterin-containing oxidoreductase family protein n=1 Tax=Dermatobacter hominis TaxID=2884263 RepID=UPI001D127584|nr:molybdopterin-dependent oxidoreductase [Dermatobacter hominis]UDY35815.1 molybdopterin-dependent oxidoreductase [Dermatobacter hominis]